MQNMSSPLHIVILAAGLGSRMRSSTPKVLHLLAGKPLLSWVLEAANALNPVNIHIIYGHAGHLLKIKFIDDKLHWIEQKQQLGTAHAVLQALPYIPDDAKILILSGDVPLIKTSTLEKLTSTTHALCLLTANIANPYGLGRIVRNGSGDIINIVEEKDASDCEKEIHEIYSGICAGFAKDFKRLLPLIKPHNAQQEFYLTDMVAIAMQHKIAINAQTVEDEIEIRGVNTHNQLITLERYVQQQQAANLLAKGVYIADPARIDIRGTVDAEQDVYIDVDVVFEGTNILKKGSRVGPFCLLKNVSLGARSEVFAHSVIEQAEIGEDCKIGPFARLRPGTKLQKECKIGNFVETKQASFAEGSKANHLSYLGDVTIGTHVNIGAGTITCNYDGVEKHKTIIEDGAFIGSGTQLVAPICVGEKATIGAGTTLRQDAPAHALTLTKRQQVSHLNWQRKKK